MGRLARDPETRYSQGGAEPLAVTRYSLAVGRKFRREGEPEADFINCVAFGKAGEFAEKYFKKGMMVCVSGRLSVSSWEDQNGQKRWSTDVVLEDQQFAESKASFEARSGGLPENGRDAGGGFGAIANGEPVDDEDLPF